MLKSIFQKTHVYNDERNKQLFFPLRSRLLNNPTILILSPDQNTQNPVDNITAFTTIALKAQGIRVRLLSLSSRGSIHRVDIIDQISISEVCKLQHGNQSQNSETTADLFTLHGLPDDLSKFDIVHFHLDWKLPALQKILAVCRERGAKKISVSHNNHILMDEISDPRAEIRFYGINSDREMEGNSGERLLQPGELRFALRNDKTVTIYQGNYATSLSAKGLEIEISQKQRGLFEGYILGQLLCGAHPVMAARYAVHLSLSNRDDHAIINSVPALTQIGVDDRVAINEQQVEKVAKVVKVMPEAQPFDYAGDKHPSVGHPHAVDYFFAVTLQQFGFWEDDGRGYQYPMIASLDGQQLKGSAYMAQAFFRKINTDPEFFSPATQINLKEGDLLDTMRSDNGSDPLPALASHLEVANRYGQDMLALDLSPHTILEKVNAEEKPLAAFIRVLDKIGGYKEDPLRKKSNLLAMILSQRPERFLNHAKGESLLPVVDYHCMRACLRLGLIDILDENLRGKVIRREFVNTDEEWAIRFAAYQIQAMVEEMSGKTIGVVDWFFFNYMRSRCFEMTAPECNICAANQVCLHRERFFQPVIRTTHY